MSRVAIPKQLRDAVHHRQKGLCAACVSVGTRYHHIFPVGLVGSVNTYRNIVLLCREHHDLFHYGDIETVKTVLEYAYYLRTGSLPSDDALVSECFSLSRARQELTDAAHQPR